MRVIFRPEAEQDLMQARAWYEAKSPGLGLEFAQAVEAAVISAQGNPFGYLRIQQEFRRVLYLARL